MKTIPPVCPEPLTGPKYWRSLDDLAEKPEVRAWVEREFPAGASLAPDGESRRDWMKLMSASFLLAGMGGMATGCRRPEAHLTPFAKQPEGYIHGKPQYYATAMPTRGSAVPLVAKATDGRPVKLEGNALVPDSNGGTDLFAQAAILNLYDPDRAIRHTKGGNDVKIEAVRDGLAALGKAAVASGGAGVVVLAERSSSPSRARLQAEYSSKLPKAKWFVYEPIDFARPNQAASIAFGADVAVRPNLERAQRILSLDCDFVGSEAEAYRMIRGYAKGRKPDVKGAEMSRLYVAESMMSLTGGQADHRLRTKPSDVVKLAALVAAQLGVGGELATAIGALAQGADARQTAWAREVAQDLLSAKGSAVVLAGYAQPLAVHLIATAINNVLGAYGTTLTLTPAIEARNDGGIVEAVAALKAGAETVIILGGNPAYNAPVDLDFAGAIKSAKNVVRLGYYEDETTALTTWHLAAAHFLESWNDARTADGTVVPVQPLIEPLFNGLTDIEVLARFLGADKTAPYELVRATFGGTDSAWKKFLHDGFAAGTAAAAATARLDAGSIVRSLGQIKSAVAPAAGEYEVVLHRSAGVDDGRYNNNGWLMECPEPVTKITWGNVIQVSPATARALGVSECAHAHDGQYDQIVLKLTVAGRSIEAPVWIQPGLADNTVAIALGYGRKVTGRVGTKVGADAFALFRSGSGHLTAGRVEKVARKQRVAVTQEHGMMEGRPVIREGNLAQFKETPGFAANMDLDAHLPHYVPEKTVPDGRNPGRLQNIYEHPYDQNRETRSKIHQWGMTIDLQSCVGCNACVIACQSENNIPIVGADQVTRGREMLWMRIDRYYSTNAKDDLRERIESEDPQMVIQPMTCQHCESAPCESVCPANATVHDEEGLNVMAYNRCIGTRYCANNCPYKVRRFNWFDFNKRETDYGAAQQQLFLNTGNLYKGPLAQDRNSAPEWEIIKLIKNPDVSVRMRGVMEKCTFCVQRIEQAKIAQKVKVGNSGEVAVPDGTIKTACQQACPAEAIVFGNILDAESEVSKLKLNPRNYSVLGFLDNRPRVTYLARIRNPNPAVTALEGRGANPDSMRDYELFRHENPFKESHGHEEKHAALGGERKGGA